MFHLKIDKGFTLMLRCYGLTGLFVLRPDEKRQLGRPRLI